MVFHWRLSDSKSPQVSRNLLNIVADLNNAVVWIVSTHPHISKSSSLCTNPMVTVPSRPITFMFHSFSVLKQGLGTHIAFCFTILPYGQPERQSPLFGRFSFFLLTITWSSNLAENKWSVCISKFKRILCVSFSRTDSGLCIYHLFVWLE